MKGKGLENHNCSKVGQIYDEKWMPAGSPFEVNERESVFENLVVKDKSLLDLGAGTLRFSLAAVQKGAKQVVAVEMLRGMLMQGIEKAKRIKKAKGKIDVIIADVRFLPFVDNSFDVAVAIELFEHIPEKVGLFVEEVYRVLKHSGEAVINTWNGIPRRLMGLRRGGREKLAYWVGGFYYRYYYPWEFKWLLKSANFSKLKILGAHSVYSFPHLWRLVSFDPYKGSLGMSFDKVFRKLTPLNQVTGQFLLAMVQK